MEELLNIIPCTRRVPHFAVATIGAIIIYFHAPHGTTKDERLHVRPDFKKVFGILVESLSAERTSYSDDDLKASSSSRVHHPENPELFGAISTHGDKSIGHEALSSRTSLTLEIERQQPPKRLLVGCLGFSALPELEEVGGNGQPCLKGLPVLRGAGLTTSTTLFLGTRQHISSESGRDLRV
jgi:hypothetical protein